MNRTELLLLAILIILLVNAMPGYEQSDTWYELLLGGYRLMVKLGLFIVEMLIITRYIIQFIVDSNDSKH